MGIQDWFKFNKKPKPRPPATGEDTAKTPSTPQVPSVAPAASNERAAKAKALADEVETQFKQAMEILAPLARICHVPRVMDGAGNADSSHFCGNAALPTGEAWPACGYCKTPMELFLQLSSKSLPPESGHPFGIGTLQVFYCVNDSCDGGDHTWDGFGFNQLTRVIPAEREVVLAQRTTNSTYPTRIIVGWDTEADYPNWEETQLYGDPLEKFLHVLGDSDRQFWTVKGDKLGGWPAWVQGVEYVSCPECGDTMAYVFQIDSETNVPYMFGDCGTAHVSICAKHPGRGAFRWACC